VVTANRAAAAAASWDFFEEFFNFAEL